MDNNSAPIINDILIFKADIEALLKSMRIDAEDWERFQSIWRKYVPQSHIDKEAVKNAENEHYANIDEFWFDLEEIVAKVHNIESATMYNLTRKRQIVEARQFVFFFIRMNFPRVSLSLVGERYKKDHSTVLHSFRNIGYLINLNREYNYKFEYILEMLRVKGYHFANNTLIQWEQYKLSCDDNGKRKFGKSSKKNRSIRNKSRKVALKRKAQ